MIREVTREDTGRVTELLRQLWPDKQIDDAGVRAILERYAEDPRYWILGYEREGTLLGVATVSFRWTLFRAGEVAVIEDLVVDAGHRMEGIGTALVRFVEDKIAQSEAAGAIEVHSDFHREDAHIFWENLGYRRLAFQFRKETSQLRSVTKELQAQY